MSRWVSRVVSRIRSLAAAGSIRMTGKALEELAALDIGLEPDEVCTVLCELKDEDLIVRVRSARSREWLYVFKPEIAGTIVYLKIAIRSQCVVISFHEDTEEE